MINRKFPEINPSNFGRNSDRKVSKKIMADKMKQAKIGDDDTDALATSKKPGGRVRHRPKGPPTGPDGVNWQWQNRGKWKSFDPQDQGLVEEKYIIFSKGQGEVHDVVLGGSWNYSLHFGKMTQMNRKSKAIKKIKRDGPSVDITWKMGAKSKEPASPSFDPVPAWMQPGALAQLTGLENAPHLNGNVVKIGSNKPEPPEGKIRVVLSTGMEGTQHTWGGEAKVKPANLKPADAPPDAPPAAPAAAPADAGSVDMSWFAEGVQATLIGLEKAPEMNGQLVSILDPVPQPADGKILVRIISTGNEAKVPPHNLQFAAAAPADTLHTPAPAPDDDAGPAPVIVPAPDPGADDDPGGTGAPVKWEYEYHGHFNAYDDDNNDKIEAAYQKYLANNKHKSTSSVEITVNGKWDFTLSFHYMNSTSHGHKKNRSKIQRTPP
jgi:hypothetical protein